MTAEDEPVELRLGFPAIAAHGVPLAEIVRLTIAGRVLDLIHQHRIRALRQEIVADDPPYLWLVFQNSFHAAKFKLLWSGWTESGIGYLVLTTRSTLTGFRMIPSGFHLTASAAQAEANASILSDVAEVPLGEVDYL